MSGQLLEVVPLTRLLLQPNPVDIVKVLRLEHLLVTHVRREVTRHIIHVMETLV